MGLGSATCRNTVIWKPSPKAPLTAVAVQHLYNQVLAELDYPGVFNLLVAVENQLAEALAQDRRLPSISFIAIEHVVRTLL